MPHPISRPLASTLIRAAVSLAVLGPVATAQAESVVGLLSNNRLFTFDSATPGSAGAPVAVTGLLAGDSLVGIDLRPTTGLIYGLAQSGALYTLNSSTGAATSLGSIGALSSGPVGIDFNPVPDLAGAASLRVVSGSTNLRINVNGAPVATVDTPLNSATTSFGDVAYINNDRDPATATALYGINGGNLYQVTNPNGGVTALIGALGVASADNVIGFDVSATGSSFAVLSAPAQGFYSINLGTGAATLIGAFNASLGGVLDITAGTAPGPVAAIPEPGTYALMLAGLVGVGAIARRRRSR